MLCNQGHGHDLSSNFRRHTINSFINECCKVESCSSTLSIELSKKDSLISSLVRRSSSDNRSLIEKRHTLII